MTAHDRDAQLDEITHDLAQPLTALINLLAALQIAIDRGAPGTATAPLLASASEQTARACAIVQRLQGRIRG